MSSVSLRALLAVVLLCAAQAPPEDPELLWSSGRRSEAIQALAARLQSSPDQTELRLALAERQLAVHWYAAALETLEPVGAQGTALRARALYRLGRWEEALTLLSRDDPSEMLLRLEALEALDRGAEAESELAHASEVLGAQHPRLLVYRARAAARRERWLEAIADFRQAVEADALDAAALFGLGRALVAAGEREEGLAVLERHRALTPLLDQRDFAERGIDLAPMHAPNHAALGDAMRALGRLEEALAAYARALELAQGEELVPIALRQARLIAEDRNDVDGAVSALETAANRIPDARLYVRSGDLLMSAGRPMDAMQRFLRARELRPGDAQIERRVDAARAAYGKASDK